MNEEIYCFTNEGKVAIIKVAIINIWTRYKVKY